MNVVAADLAVGDVLADEAQSGIVTDLEELGQHVRVRFADGQARSYLRERSLALVCARLAACPHEFCDARSCRCKPCGCRVCLHRSARAQGRVHG